MFKRLSNKYWPMVAFLVFCGAILCMSRYAGNRQSDQAHDTKTSSPQTPVSPSDTGNGSHNADEFQHHPDIVDTFLWPNGATVWALLLTLIVIAWQSAETRAAAIATEDAVRDGKKAYVLAEDTAKRQLRPYFAVKTARLMLHDNGTVEPRLEILNCGQTPAYHLQGAITGAFSKYPFVDPGRPPASTPMSTGTIGAGLPFNVAGNIYPSGMRTPAEVIALLESPDFVFFLKGYYTYKDIFKDHHWIEFRYVAGGFAGVGRSTTEEGTFIHFCNDREGNDAD